MTTIPFPFARPRGAMEARRFPEPEVVGSIPTAGDLLSALGTWALSSVEERPFRIREVEGSNPSVSTLFSSTLSVAQLVEHVTVDVCDHRVAGSIPAAEIFFAFLSLPLVARWR